MATPMRGQQVHLSQSALTDRTSEHIYGVVLAGGNGERLWPLSRAEMPKQLLSVGSEKSLLEQALNRLAVIMPLEHLFVSTTKAYENPIKKVVGDCIGGILVEPGARNTGPALMLSCLRLYEQDPQALIVFVPADPYIQERDTPLFCKCLVTMLEHSARYPVISLCGVRPTFPATGYGYIAYGDAEQGALPVLGFKEKPSLALAQQYVDSGMMLWNTGIFCAQAEVFIDEYKQHAPELYAEIKEVYKGSRSYDTVAALSIDYAVLEKSNKCVVVPASFSWCDVGNLAVFLSLQKQDPTTKVFAVDAHNNLVSAPHKTVALVGVNDLCIVETETALLICKQSEAEKVRGVAQQFKTSGKNF